MNYIKQIKYYWLLHKIHQLSAKEAGMYFYLLEQCNERAWPEEFVVYSYVLQGHLDLKSYSSLLPIRNKLRDAGLISFNSEQGSKNCAYRILELDDSSIPKTEKRVKTSIETSLKNEEVNAPVPIAAETSIETSTQTSIVTSLKNNEVLKPVLLYNKPEPKPQIPLIQIADAEPPPSGKKIDAAKKETAVKQEKEPGLHTQCMAIYCKWFENKFSAGPKIDGAQGKALKELIAYIKTLVAKQHTGPPPDDEFVAGRVLANWQGILDNWHRLENFYQKQTKLTQINSNIQNLIVQLKNPTQHGTGNSKQHTPTTGKITPIWRKGY